MHIYIYIHNNHTKQGLHHPRRPARRLGAAVRAGGASLHVKVT